MVSLSAVEDAVIVTDALPSTPVVAEVEENLTSPLVANATTTFGTGWFWASLTRAVAVDCEAPSAGIDGGERVSVVLLAVLFSVRAAVPLMLFVVLAVIVSWPAVFDEWIVAV